MAELDTKRKFGKYELVAHLATGGMADIFLARQTGIAGFEKLLVVKRILPHLAREEFFVKMFLDEARIAARLNHQNVVQTYDLGCEDGQYFIAMEYLEGESLAEVMRQVYKLKENIPPFLAAGIMHQVCNGLHHAHSMVGPDGKPMKLVHRDVTPQNIFVLYTGGVKLMDFGIAKATYRSSHTNTGALKGKFRYMSPEQVKNLPLDARSDVFSAGVVFWEMLAGRRLFAQASELDVLMAIAKQDAPPPSRFNPNVPEELEDIAMKALRRSREERYQSAAEMGMDLNAATKKSNEPSDSVAVGEYVRWLFYDRMVEKQLLVKKALSHGADLDQSLFEDLPGDGSDGSNQSIPPKDSRQTITPEPVDSAESKATGPGAASEPGPKAGASFIKTALAVLGGMTLLAAVLYLVVAGTMLDESEPKIEPLPPPMFGSKPTGAANEQGPKRLDTAPGATGKSGVKQGIPMQVQPGSRMKPSQSATKNTLGNHQSNESGSTVKQGKGLPPARQGKVVKKKRKPRKRKRVKNERPGLLRLDTAPWTTVYLHGKKLGITPLVDVKLPAGTHELRVVNESKGIDRNVKVIIRPGKTTVKWFRF